MAYRALVINIVLGTKRFRLSSWWRHQMETFFALLAICAGNSPVIDEFPARRPVTRRFDVSFIFAWINVWANNREAGNLRRHRVHNDVIVMLGPVHDIIRYNKRKEQTHTPDISKSFISNNRDPKVCIYNCTFLWIHYNQFVHDYLLSKQIISKVSFGTIWSFYHSGYVNNLRMCIGNYRRIIYAWIMRYVR